MRILTFNIWSFLRIIGWHCDVIYVQSNVWSTSWTWHHCIDLSRNLMILLRQNRFLRCALVILKWSRCVSHNDRLSWIVCGSCYTPSIPVKPEIYRFLLIWVHNILVKNWKMWLWWRGWTHKVLLAVFFFIISCAFKVVDHAWDTLLYIVTVIVWTVFVKTLIEVELHRIWIALKLRRLDIMSPLWALYKVIKIQVALT